MTGMGGCCWRQDGTTIADTRATSVILPASARILTLNDDLIMHLTIPRRKDGSDYNTVTIQSGTERDGTESFALSTRLSSAPLHRLLFSSMRVGGCCGGIHP